MGNSLVIVIPRGHLLAQKHVVMCSHFCTAHPFTQLPKSHALQWAIKTPQKLCLPVVYLHTPSNTWFPGSTHPKQDLDRFSRFCTAQGGRSLYFTMGHPFPPKNCHFPWGDLDPNLIHGSLSPLRPTTQTASP